MSQPHQPPQGGPNQYGQGQNPQWSAQPGYQPQGYPQQPPKKKGGCLKVGLIILAVLIVLGIVIAAIGGGGDDTKVSSNSSDSSSEGGEAGGGVEFMGKTDKDTGANAGDTITQNDLAVTTTPLETRQAEYLPTQMCTNITIQNNSGDQKQFNLVDWKLQDPNGAALMGTPPYDNPTGGFSYGDLAPGGSVSGDLCFDGDPTAMPGQYVVLYQGNFFMSDRLGWVNNL